MTVAEAAGGGEVGVGTGGAEGGANTARRTELSSTNTLQADPHSDTGSPTSAARTLNVSVTGCSESETGTDMPYSESDMDDSFSEQDSLLGGSGRLMHTPARQQRRQQTHSHLASACSIPGMLIDSAARSSVLKSVWAGG